MRTLRPRRVVLTFDDVVRLALPAGAIPDGDKVVLRVRDSRIDREIDLGTFGAELILEWFEPDGAPVPPVKIAKDGELPS